MQHDVDVFQATFKEMIHETQQAAYSMSALSECVEAYVEYKPADKIEGPMHDIMWVFTQISNHQRYMLERMEKRIQQVTAVTTKDLAEIEGTDEHFLATSGL